MYCLESRDGEPDAHGHYRSIHCVCRRYLTFIRFYIGRYLDQQRPYNSYCGTDNRNSGRRSSRECNDNLYDANGLLYYIPDVRFDASSAHHWGHTYVCEHNNSPVRCSSRWYVEQQQYGDIFGRSDIRYRFRHLCRCGDHNLYGVKRMFCYYFSNGQSAASVDRGRTHFVSWHNGYTD